MSLFSICIILALIIRPLYFRLVVSSTFFLSFSSPNLSCRRLDVCHTLHMVWP